MTDFILRWYGRGGLIRALPHSAKTVFMKPATANCFKTCTPLPDTASTGRGGSEFGVSFCKKSS